MYGKHSVIATLFASVLLTVIFIPISSNQVGTDRTPLVTQQASKSDPKYDPWADYNGDGIIDIDDVLPVALAYGTSGTPFAAEAAVEYDSGWVNIIGKAGQYFNITHNLDSTDIMVDITGKTTMNSGVHQRHLGLTCYTPGWSRSYGGTGGEYAYSMVQTSDGGYALGGWTDFYGAGGADFWLVKTDSAGNLQWNKTYGGIWDDWARSVVQTSDGGYALAGSTYNFSAGTDDAWLVKTDSAGNMQWNKTYGGGFSVARSVVQTRDGGYALAGTTYNLVTGNVDFWLVKTEVESGLAWTDSTVNTITLYRGATDAYWNYVRVRIWKIKENP